MPLHHPRYDCGPGCPVEAALDLIGGKWKGVAMHHLLAEAPLRFSELRRRMPDATPRVLSRQLRELEADGLVTRRVAAGVPPRVEYEPTPLGRGLQPVVEALGRWGTAWLSARGAGPTSQAGAAFTAAPP